MTFKTFSALSTILASVAGCGVAVPLMGGSPLVSEAAPQIASETSSTVSSAAQVGQMGAPGDGCDMMLSGLVRCKRDVGTQSPALANAPGELLSASLQPRRPEIGSEFVVSGSVSEKLQQDFIRILLVVTEEVGGGGMQKTTVVLGLPKPTAGQFEFRGLLASKYEVEGGIIVDLVRHQSTYRSARLWVEGHDSEGTPVGIAIGDLP